MKGKRKYFVSIALFAMMFLFTFYFIFSKYPFAEFIKIIQNCNYFFIFLAFLMVFSYLFFEAWFFKALFRQFDIKISWWQAVSYVCIEVYFSAVTPSSTGGQPVQAYYMGRDKIPYTKSTIVILINTMLYKFAILLLGILALLFFPKLMLQNGWFFSTLMIMGMLGNVLIIAFFGALLYSKTLPRKVLKLGFRLLCFLHFIKPEKKSEKEDKLEASLEEYHECAKFTRKNPKIMGKLFIFIFFQRMSIFVISYIIYLAFGLHGFGFWEIVALQIGITLAMDSVPLPGGVMVGEGFTFKVNQFIYGAGLAMSSMLLLRGISFYFLVLFSGLIFVIYHFCGKKRGRKI